MFSLIQMAVVFALVLGAMVVIHEFGHFIVAKYFGIRVEVFSVGFGRRLWGFKKGDTDYRLSLIPLGGYVKMAGENLDEQTTGAPDEFSSKPKWQRFCVAVAGPVMNILTALAIPAALAMIHYEAPAYLNQPAVINAVAPGSPAETAGLQSGDLVLKVADVENPTWRDLTEQVIVRPDQDIDLTVQRNGEIKHITVHAKSDPSEEEKIGYIGARPSPGQNARVTVESVLQGKPAEQAGLKEGDQIVAVNGKPLPQDWQGGLDLNRAIQSSGGQQITVTVKRGGETIDLKAVPQQTDTGLLLGFNHAIRGSDVIITRLGPIEALQYSWDMNVRILKLTKTALTQVFVGQRKASDTFTGPVGIFKLSGDAAERGASSVFQLMALLSLNLGIFNLLPIPVLDGGLIFMLALEGLLGLFGFQLLPRIKERMMQVGFVMLMLLMGFVIFNDISKLIPSNKPAAQQAEQPAPPKDK